MARHSLTLKRDRWERESVWLLCRRILIAIPLVQRSSPGTMPPGTRTPRLVPAPACGARSGHECQARAAPSASPQWSPRSSSTPVPRLLQGLISALQGYRQHGDRPRYVRRHAVYTRCRLRSHPAPLIRKWMGVNDVKQRHVRMVAACDTESAPQRDDGDGGEIGRDEDAFQR